MARGTDADVALLGALEAIELAGAALEELIVSTGLIDPALAGVVSACAAHHHLHAAAYQEAAGSASPGVADEVVVQALAPAIFTAVDGPSMLAAALAVEEALAATAIDAVGRFDDATLAALAGSIGPVESEHVAVLAAAVAAPLERATPEVVLGEASVLHG